jgi:multiple sugar transport system substrate-binding protein
MNGNRRLALALVPVAAAMVALASCSSGAPASTTSNGTTAHADATQPASTGPSTHAGKGQTGSAPSGNKPKSLNLWLPTSFTYTTSKERTAWKGMLAPFESKNNVKINLTLIPWANYEQKYLAGVSSGSGPDVGYMYKEMIGDYAVRNQLVPFDKYLTAKTKNNMIYLNQGKYRGKQYAMPFIVGSMRVLWVNMDLLKKAGIKSKPKTWSEFTSDGKKLKAAGITPLQEAWGDPETHLDENYFPLLWQAGGKLFNSQGTKTAFNSKPGLKAAKYIMSLINDGVMPSTVSGLSNDNMEKAFMSGKTAFMFESSGLLPQVKKTDFDYSFVPSLKDKQKGTFIAGDSLVLLKSCPDKQLCASLVQYMEAGPQMAKVHKGIIQNPPIGKDEKVQSHNPFEPLYKSDNNFLHTLPIVPGGVAAYNALYTNLQKMVLGQMTPKQALSDAAKKGDAAISKVGT